MQNSIKKYYIGLGILAVLVLCLLGYVLVQASTYKKDKEVNQRASEIAEELNFYISDEKKLPEELSDVVSDNIPKEITYDKESEKRYKFCVTYNSSSTGVTSPQQVLVEGLYGNFGDTGYGYESDYASSSLYVSTYSWDKGEQCQKVEPYYLNSYDYDNENYESGSFDDLDYVCEPDYEYYSTYKDYCVDGKYEFFN